MGEKQSQIAITILLHEVPNETSLQFNMERGKEIKGDHSYIENFFESKLFLCSAFSTT
jgi:hypothetical protein